MSSLHLNPLKTDSFKGDPKFALKTQKTCKYLPLYGGSINLYGTKVRPCFEFELLLGHVGSLLVIGSLSMNSRKRVAHGVIDTCTTHASLIRTITLTIRQCYLAALADQDKNCTGSIFCFIPVDACDMSICIYSYPEVTEQLTGC